MNINGYCSLGHATTGGSYTEFTVDDGVVDIGLAPSSLGDLILGWYDTDANVDVTLNGGAMTVGGAIYMGRTMDAVGDPITPTGMGSGQLRINIAGGILKAEDYIDAGTFTNHRITFTDGMLKINNLGVSQADMLALIAGGDISCPNGYVIYTAGDYTVLARSMPTNIPGDANNDGTVDDLDAKTLADNWGKLNGADWTMGDFNADGKVNALDASIMAANWGYGTNGESTVVPEPTVLALLLALVAPVVLTRRRRR